MKKAKATDIKNHLGEYLDIAKAEPVMIQKSGRDSAVILSIEEYRHLQAMEDYYWGQIARESEKEESLGHEESIAFLKRLAVEKLGEAPES